MNNSWFFNENFNGIPDDFFDDAMKLLDFPMEDVEPKDGGEDWEAKVQELEPPPANVLVGLSSSLGGENSNNSLNVKKSCSVSHEKPSQLKEWPSTAEASSSRSVPLHHDSSEAKYSHPSRTRSPVSVLESSSSSSCSTENPKTHCPRFVIPVKRPRSKHPRTQRNTFPLIFNFCASKTFRPSIASESESETYLDDKMLGPGRKQMRRNPRLLSCAVKVKKPSSRQSLETRKCTHCETMRTPQWREGPMGPKTLCNACGVRYRSGRLFPEYRPASSPTFVASVHSNSHRKVTEIRRYTERVNTLAPNDAVTQKAPEYYF